jgi:hypothetical protein
MFWALRPPLPLRYSITALSVETHLPEGSHGVPEDDDQPGEGCCEQRRPEASELSSAVFYSWVCYICMRERVL